MTTTTVTNTGTPSIPKRRQRPRPPAEPRPLPGLPAPRLEFWAWQEQAACRDVNPEMFFPPEGERGIRRRAREEVARALCGTCPVRDACRRHADEVHEPYGVWGGITQSERDPATLG